MARGHSAFAKKGLLAYIGIRAGNGRVAIMPPVPETVFVIMNTLMPYPLPTVTPREPVVIHEMISKRAEELWLDLGCPLGRDLEIWIEAEAEIQAMLHKTFRHPHL